MSITRALLGEVSIICPETAVSVTLEDEPSWETYVQDCDLCGPHVKVSFDVYSCPGCGGSHTVTVSDSL